MRKTNLLWCLCCLCWPLAVSAAEPLSSPPLSVTPLSIEKPCIAYWTFDEDLGTGRLRDASGHPEMGVEIGLPVSTRRGVFGKALFCEGKHSLKTKGFGAAELTGFTICAWVRPSDLSGFREIYRQESGHRVLFSFQGDGAILALGLSVGGYVECDAALDRAQAKDGQWHHAAGVFDGAAMRVYWDGQPIGELPRPGKLALDPRAPGFIGSSGGDNEFYAGGMDDLRIYADALTPEEIAALERNGREALAGWLKLMDETVDKFYRQESTFAASLAAARQRLADHPVPIDEDLAGAFLRRVRADFPRESDDFATYTGVSPREYVTTDKPRFMAEQAERLLGLLIEYKPLTEHQWSNQTPQDLEKWRDTDQYQQRFDALRAQGEAGLSEAGWIDFILAVGPKITFRPVVHEPVAPYIRPETPETRDLTPDEARETLERDWLHQAGKDLSPERIRAEIQWTRDLIARLTAAAAEADYTSFLSELDALEKRAEADASADTELYFAVRRIKRQVVLSNPLLDFNQVVFVDMPYPQGSEWPHETRHRLGYMAVPGARLLILEGLGPEGHLRQLMPQPPLRGSFWRADVSFDGQKILVCFKPHNEKSFHLYEIGADGSGLTQLTDGPYDDIDPIYLPEDGHIQFITTRGHNYVRCMPPTNSFELARADRDGKNVYLISYNNEPDYLPSVMNDGRVVYTRWEYTDKPLWRAQKLWTVNPDGTQVNTLWGNQSVWPDVMKDARAIPGSRRIMFTGSAHHNWFAGSVGIIDPERGFNFPNGLTKITADVEWPECGNGPVDPVESPRYHASGDYPAYYSPYPLGEQDFLVSAQRNGKFLLYLMDVDGNRELIYEGLNNIFHALPLKPRPKPPILVDRVDWPTQADKLQPKPGVFYSNNVYHGAPPELNGKARFLRILTIEAKTYTYWYKRPYISTGPVVSAVQSEGVKRILGTVPIEDDGSVIFEAPSGTALHFQLLDENQRALHTMRSFAGLMPGERRGCLGCHESHSRTPQTDAKGAALTRAPHPITPPPWDDTTVSYPRYVQSVLDQYCGECHQGEGKARKIFDLTERPTEPILTEPYMTIIGRPSWGAPYEKPKNPPPGFGIANVLMVEAFGQIDPQAYQTPKPMTCMSYNSKLIEIASSGKHHDVKVDAISLQRLIVWIDAMCPYLGDPEVRAIDDPEFQGIDWLAVRPRIKTAPVIVRPGPVD
jgi:hypothetical protein